MSDDPATMVIPKGFAPLVSRTPFSDLAGPFYFKQSGSAVVLGMRLEDKHCNSAGTAHGGLITTLADIALGHNIRGAKTSGSTKTSDLAKSLPMATVSMTTDFLGAARAGDWIEVHVEIQKLGNTISFADAHLMSSGQKIARVSGVYRSLA